MAREDCLSRLARSGHTAGVSAIDAHRGEKAASGLGLGAAVGIEGNVDLALKATLSVPVGFAVTHQQQSGA